MTLRSVALLAVALLSLAACSAEAADSSASSTSNVEAEKNATPNALVDQTVVKGSLDVGISRVAYAGDEYEKKQINGVPYLAWEIDGVSDHLSIAVEGNFPSSPDVLLVDASFNLLGQAQGTATDLGDKATLEVNAKPGKKLVLVRDMEWVRPMDFEISVAR